MHRLLHRIAAATALALAGAGLTTVITDAIPQPADTAWGAPDTITDTAWGTPPVDAPQPPFTPGPDGPVTTFDTAWG